MPTRKRDQQRKEDNLCQTGKPRKAHLPKTLWQAPRVNLEIRKMGMQEEMVGVGVWETC